MFDDPQSVTQHHIPEEWNPKYDHMLSAVLTLSVGAEYIYSVASQATSPGGVYILRDFHTLVKKEVLGLLASGLYH